MFVILRFPHLVLAHIRNNDRISTRLAPEVIHDVSGIEMAIVRQVLNVAHRRVAFQFLNTR